MAKSSSSKGSIIRGRFNKPVHPLAQSFSASHAIDRRLYPYDILGSKAHARMLHRIGLVNQTELRALLKGLTQIEKELTSGQFKFHDALEDIHMHIEARLIEIIGETGEKLHTGRSRNDQVALDFRLYCRQASLDISKRLEKLQDTLLVQAKKHVHIFMPSYTHLQQAQVIRAAHHFLAYMNMFARDLERIKETQKRINVLPLGSGAAAGTGLDNDRSFVALELGFPQISENSLDGVSDRDFALEMVFNISVIGMHLSRYTEELIIWMSQEFDMIEMDAAFCTGSSLMPQKSNPDMAELIRGKTGNFLGHLVSLYTMLKALPLAYNRDMQEDKAHVFQAVDEILKCLDVFTLMLQGLHIKPNLLERQKNDFMLATDVAEYLVRFGLPFRKAHEITGKAVNFAHASKKSLSDLKLEEWQKFYKPIDITIMEILDLANSADQKKTFGGTAVQEINRQIRYWEKQHKNLRKKKS